MTDMTTAGRTEIFACIPYYNQRASNPAIAPRSDWLDAQQGQGSAARQPLAPPTGPRATAPGPLALRRARDDASSSRR